MFQHCSCLLSNCGIDKNSVHLMKCFIHTWLIYNVKCVEQQHVLFTDHQLQRWGKFPEASFLSSPWCSWIATNKKVIHTWTNVTEWWTNETPCCKCVLYMSSKERMASVSHLQFTSWKSFPLEIPIIIWLHTDIHINTDTDTHKHTHTQHTRTRGHKNLTTHTQ